MKKNNIYFWMNNGEEEPTPEEADYRFGMEILVNAVNLISFINELQNSLAENGLKELNEATEENSQNGEMFYDTSNPDEYGYYRITDQVEFENGEPKAACYLGDGTSYSIIAGIEDENGDLLPEENRFIIIDIFMNLNRKVRKKDDIEQIAVTKDDWFYIPVR